jgi:hypothetical protein
MNAAQEEIDTALFDSIKGTDAASKVRIFYYYLLKNKKFSYKQEKEFFSASPYIISYYRQKGYSIEDNKLDLNSNSLLWDKFLEHRKCFLPDERFPISNLYFSISEPKPVFSNKGAMFSAISTVIIWKYKVENQKKIKFYDVLILYFTSLKFNPKISIHYSTLNGIPLYKIIGLNLPTGE